MAGLAGIIEKLKRWLSPAAAGASAKADTGSPAEQEARTNAQPAGANDEPWSGTGS